MTIQAIKTQATIAEEKMQTKTITIIIIAAILVLGIGIYWYASTNAETKGGLVAGDSNSENAPDLTTDDGVFGEIDNTADGLE